VEIFDEQAIAAVHKLTDGVPRLINQLCDHALLAAAAQQATMIDQRIVEMAWADLQQLPAPFTAEESVAPTSNVIEFGQLDDMAVEPALSSVEQSEPISDVIEIVPLEEAIGETGEPIAVEEDPAEVMVPQLVQETEPPLEALLPLESGDLVARQDSAGQEDFSPLTTSSSQGSSEVGREWTVVAPLEDEPPVVAGKEDEVSLIIRRDEEHQIAADHQQVSAEALERQRKLLDRFRQA
jgi:hypothetical protein